MKRGHNYIKEVSHMATKAEVVDIINDAIEYDLNVVTSEIDGDVIKFSVEGEEETETYKVTVEKVKD